MSGTEIQRISSAIVYCSDNNEVIRTRRGDGLEQRSIWRMLGCNIGDSVRFVICDEKVTTGNTHTGRKHLFGKPFGATSSTIVVHAFGSILAACLFRGATRLPEAVDKGCSFHTAAISPTAHPSCLQKAHVRR